MKSLFVTLAFVRCAVAMLHADSAQQPAADIDRILTSHWQSAKVIANDPVNDETFVRRVYLDLAGRIPTSDEALRFIASKQGDKRSALIDELLARESYVSHFYNVWADILRLKSQFVNRSPAVPAAYAKFIKESLRSNKNYDEFVREMLAAKGFAWDTGAVGYYDRDPDMPLDNMALTTRIFLGTRIECAQCHDHPFDKWKQTEFYHLAAYTYGNKSVSEALSGVRDAFRAREQAIKDDFLKEKAAATDGGKAAEQRRKQRLDEMEFRPTLNLIRSGIGQLLSPIGIERKQDAVLKLPFDFKQDDGKPGDVMTPAPIFGTRPELSDANDRADVFAHWLASSENPRFTSVIVNRLWKQMFGVALIEPLDDLRDDTKAMVPELEQYLEKLMISLRYDMRAFLAVIANTRAYQSAVCADEFAAGSTFHFTGPLLRRMTAEQIWDSIVALANDEPDARDLVREARDQRRIDISHMVADAYNSYDGTKMVDLGYANLKHEQAIQAKEKALRDEEVAANRRGEKTKVTELRRALGKLTRERNEAFVSDFLSPLMANLAKLKTGSESNINTDETYVMNTNPSVLAVETWRTKHIPGYGPAPKTKAQLEAEAKAEQQRLTDLAKKHGYTDKDRDGFIAYCERAKTEWLRASELDSPAPRGHFIRTMGQSDRDFVENANPNASIPQALAMMNGDLLTDKALLSPYSPLMRHIAQARAADQQIEAVFLALFSRRPTGEEKALWSASSSRDVKRLIYALLNTKQFVFNQ